jgi:hypothetical protein
MAKKKVEKKPLQKGRGQFFLVGSAKINDYTFKIDETSQKSDWVYNVLNLGVDAGNGNTVYAEMMGGYGAERDNVLYVHGVKVDPNNDKKFIDDYTNRFTIDFDDRFNEDVLETIGDGCFIKVGLEKDTKDKTVTRKFLSSYDAIQYIQENLTDGTVINAKGNIKYSLYNDNVQMKKEITSVFLSKATPDKYRASFVQTILLDKDSIGKFDKEKGTVPIYAKVVDYTKEYNGKEVKTMIPFDRVFEYEIDVNDKLGTQKKLEYLFKVKKGVTEMVAEGRIVEGEARVVVTDDDIPDDIKALIDLGIYSREDAIGKIAVGNNKEKRMIIERPAIKNEGTDENKTSTIQIFKEQYTEEDLILDFMLQDDDDEEDDTPPFDVDLKKDVFVDDDTDEEEEEDEDAPSDDDSWLDELG